MDFIGQIVSGLIIMFLILGVSMLVITYLPQIGMVIGFIVLFLGGWIIGGKISG